MLNLIKFLQSLFMNTNQHNYLSITTGIDILLRVEILSKFYIDFYLVASKPREYFFLNIVRVFDDTNVYT